MRLTELDLNKLSTFLAVADAGGVGKAAARLGRTSSAVSQSIGALESALGVLLFDRRGKRLILTRGGQTLRACVAACERQLERGVAELYGGAGSVSGVVRLGAYIGFPRRRLAALLLEFTRRHPNASVRVVHAPRRELERRLQNNQLDFVLSFGDTGPEPRPLVSIRLLSQELVLVSSERHRGDGSSLEALARTPVVDYYESDPLIVRWLAHHYPQSSLVPRVLVWAATTDLVLELLLHGAGAGVLPRQVAFAGLANGELVELGPKHEPLIDTIWLLAPRGAHRDVTLRAFQDVACSVFAAGT